MIQDAITHHLQSGPKDTEELRALTGMRGGTLSNAVRELLRKGRISRVETTKGRYRYYIGDTAPGWTGYIPAVRKSDDAPRLTRGTKYKVPVRHMAFPGEGGRYNRVTIVALPWEVAA